MLRRHEPAAANMPRQRGDFTKALGLELLTLDAAAARRLGLAESTRGVAIVKVDPTRPLAAYCRVKDVIGTIGGEPMRTAEDAARALVSLLDVLQPPRGPELQHAASVLSGRAR